MSESKSKIDIILIFIAHFFLYIVFTILFFNSLKCFIAIASIYYFFSIIIFSSIIIKDMKNHSGKIFWKVILVFDFLLFFLVLPILPLLALSGLAWR